MLDNVIKYWTWFLFDMSAVKSVFDEKNKERKNNFTGLACVWGQALPESHLALIFKAILLHFPGKLSWIQ